MTRATPAIALLVLFGAGCQSMRQSDPSPDEQFGHRIEGRDEEGRETLMIVPPDDEGDYSTYPATYESVTVRPSAPDPDDAEVAVELLIKGAFPDACTELHDVDQRRAGNLVEVELTMRRPQGALCAAVLRPYRFYLMLEGRYAPGPYSLTLNGRSHPFEIAAPRGP